MTRTTDNSQSALYRGRFAPSPSGPLHFGSLIAAVGSYLEARSRDGEWLVRMEDLDPPREEPGASDDILRTLEQFGFMWDGPVLYQSSRIEAYQDALSQLESDRQTYGCACSRKEINEIAEQGVEGPIYPGTCRGGLSAGRKPRSIRLLTPIEPHRFTDKLCGEIIQSISTEIGDFVVCRADGIIAYQLAVVVDDDYQGITDVVRGADLLNSTPRQIHLQSLLGIDLLNYAHLPLILNESGQKLSKQNGARPISRTPVIDALIASLRFLQQPLPEEIPDDPESFWQWAIANWNIERIPAPILRF